jgi:hypothetical protein
MVVVVLEETVNVPLLALCILVRPLPLNTGVDEASASGVTTSGPSPPVAVPAVISAAVANSVNPATVAEASAFVGGAAHVPSPLQKVEEVADVPLLRFPTGRFPVTWLVKFINALVITCPERVM